MIHKLKKIGRTLDEIKEQTKQIIVEDLFQIKDLAIPETEKIDIVKMQEQINICSFQILTSISGIVHEE